MTNILTPEIFARMAVSQQRELLEREIVLINGHLREEASRGGEAVRDIRVPVSSWLSEAAVEELARRFRYGRGNEGWGFDVRCVETEPGRYALEFLIDLHKMLKPEMFRD